MVERMIAQANWVEQLNPESITCLIYGIGDLLFQGERFSFMNKPVRQNGSNRVQETNARGDGKEGYQPAPRDPPYGAHE